jgi:hypothetical protein
MSPGDPNWMAGLRPVGNVTDILAGSAASPGELDRAVSTLGQQIAAWGVETAARVVEQVRESEQPVMATGFERQGCEECLLSTLAALYVDADPHDMVAPPGAMHNTRAAVRQGVGVGAVLRTVWASHTLVQDELLRVLEDQISLDTVVGEVRQLSTQLFAYVSAYVRDLSDSYDDERRLWNGRLPTLRRAVLESIVAGDDPPADAESILGMRLEGVHVLALAWASVASFVPDRDAEMHRLLADVSVATAAQGSVAISLGDVTVLWWRYSNEIDREIESVIANVPRPTWVRLTIGVPGTGVAGIRGGMRAAQFLRPLASVGRDRGAWTELAHGLAALFAVDIEASKRFASIEIAPLLGEDARLRELREALRLYLRHGRSRAAVAAELMVAPNTVAARVRRATELLGHEIDERWFEILVALEISALTTP